MCLGSSQTAPTPTGSPGDPQRCRYCSSSPPKLCLHLRAAQPEARAHPVPFLPPSLQGTGCTTTSLAQQLEAAASPPAPTRASSRRASTRPRPRPGRASAGPRSLGGAGRAARMPCSGRDASSPGRASLQGQTTLPSCDSWSPESTPTLRRQIARRTRSLSADGHCYRCPGDLILKAVGATYNCVVAPPPPPSPHRRPRPPLPPRPRPPPRPSRRARCRRHRPCPSRRCRRPRPLCPARAPASGRGPAAPTAGPRPAAPTAPPTAAGSSRRSRAQAATRTGQGPTGPASASAGTRAGAQPPPLGARPAPRSRSTPRASRPTKLLVVGETAGISVPKNPAAYWANYSQAISGSGRHLHRRLQGRRGRVSRAGRLEALPHGHPLEDRQLLRREHRPHPRAQRQPGDILTPTRTGRCPTPSSAPQTLRWEPTRTATARRPGLVLTLISEGLGYRCLIPTAASWGEEPNDALCGWMMASIFYGFLFQCTRGLTHPPALALCCRPMQGLDRSGSWGMACLGRQPGSQRHHQERVRLPPVHSLPLHLQLAALLLRLGAQHDARRHHPGHGLDPGGLREVPLMRHRGLK